MDPLQPVLAGDHDNDPAYVRCGGLATAGHCWPLLAACVYCVTGNQVSPGHLVTTGHCSYHGPPGASRRHDAGTQWGHVYTSSWGRQGQQRHVTAPAGGDTWPVAAPVRAAAKLQISSGVRPGLSWAGLGWSGTAEILSLS